MLYKFDKQKMNYVIATRSYLKILLIILTSSILSFVTALYMQNDKLNSIKYITEETRMLVINQENEFSEEKLKEYIIGLNIKFPHIVFAQAKLESGYFKSTIFRENNNLFGMRLAKQRPRTALGAEHNHAYYNNWRESVQDYAMYAAAYLNDIKTEQDYFEYLKINYATDPNYINKLKKIK
jgi:hypothetical protein